MHQGIMVAIALFSIHRADRAGRQWVAGTRVDGNESMSIKFYNHNGTGLQGARNGRNNSDIRAKDSASKSR